jgi:hypothetical protein
VVPYPPLKRYSPNEVIPPDLSIRDGLTEMAKKRASTWSMFNRTIKGNPYTFDVSGLIDKLVDASTATERKRLMLRHRPFLVQPLNDPHPHKVYKKGRQVGVSELSVTEVLWFLDSHPNTKWIYTFPREKQLTDFSTTRITEAMGESPRMKHLFGVPNQTFLKKVGASSFLLLRSAWESNLGEGVDADGVTFDEKDRMKEGIEVAFRESLSSSKYGLLREVSTPTLPGRGVDATFMHSDQQEWHVKCEKCGLWQPIEYPDNVVQMMDVAPGAKELPPGAYEYRCRKERCRGSLDRVHGYWVPKYPTRKNIRGYLIPQTICPWISATEMMQKKIDYKFQQFWENYVLAKTSIGENVLLSEQDFVDSVAGHDLVFARSPDWAEISVGIDWGHLNWVVVIGKNAHNGRRYLLNLAVFEDDPRQELESVKGIDAFISPFQPDIIVADAGYGKDRNSYLLKRYPERLFACWYNPSEKGSRTFQPSWSDAFAKVLVDRTMTIKDTCRFVKDKELGLPKWDRSVQLLAKHFTNLAPMRIEEEGEIYEVIEKTGDDHLVHALGYAKLGLDKLDDSVSSFSFDF